MKSFSFFHTNKKKTVSIKTEIKSALVCFFVRLTFQSHKLFIISQYYYIYIFINDQIFTHFENYQEICVLFIWVNLI